MINNVFSKSNTSKIDVITYKNILLKKNIIKLIDKKGPLTLNAISLGIKCSIPKSATIVQELIDGGLIEDLGKMETGAGRKPSLYGLINDSVLFVGIHVRNDSVDFGIVDLNENVICLNQHIPFKLDNSKESLDKLCNIVENGIQENEQHRDCIATICINLPGRVNSKKGISNNFYNFTNKSLATYLTEIFNIDVSIENDTRAKAYCEFHARMNKKQCNILYINADYGLGLGALVEGRLQYGKSGYSGEFGHTPFFQNDTACRCGKTGCLETEVSGIAIIEQFKAMIKEGHSSPLQTKYKNINDVVLIDIVRSAVDNEDLLAIEIIRKTAHKLGLAVTTLIHLYNPDTIVFGGTLSLAGEYFVLPIKLAIFKRSFELMRSDMKIELPVRLEGAGVVGACYLSKHNFLK
ncbi:MAG: ROK family protein [Mangrovibacterium sp.]